MANMSLPSDPSFSSAGFVQVSAPTSVDGHPLEATDSNPLSLSHAVWTRRAEYTRPHKLRIKIGTWNVAACPNVEKDIKSWFVDGEGVDARLGGLHLAGEAGVSKSNATAPGLLEPGSDGERIVLGGEHIGLYVLGLQEIVTLASAKEYLGRVYVDSGPEIKWLSALDAAVPEGYTRVASTQMSGLLLLIYASPSIAPTIGSVSNVSVGTGMLGYMGNKGAVVTRLILGETTRLVFINSHLASGVDNAHVERRCWDYQQITGRTVFDPVVHSGVVEDAREVIGDEDFAFWLGDLNFRLDGLPGDDIRRILTLHTKGEYAIDSRHTNTQQIGSGPDEPVMIRHAESDDDEDTPSSTPSTSQPSAHDLDDLVDPDDLDMPSTPFHDNSAQDDDAADPHNDPLSLQATIDSLLPHDQLHRVMRQQKAFHDGWREGTITFLPTYKYDIGSFGAFDSSEKKRAPSWCDRILYRSRKDKRDYEDRVKQKEESRKRDEELRKLGVAEAAASEAVLFDYDPNADGDASSRPVANTTDDYDEYDEYNENDDVDSSENVLTKEGYIDNLALELYTSHQRITTSDHKPLDAIFRLLYDAVVPELKSKIHQEVARELDRAENEGRPGITVLVDHSADYDDDDDTEFASENKGRNGRDVTTDAAQGVEFGDVRYLRWTTRVLTIANTGAVPATFAFAPRPSEDGEGEQIAPPWLRVSFSHLSDDDVADHQSVADEVTLEPGDTIAATLTIEISDLDIVRQLNAQKTIIDDVLVLRVSGGRDYFIPVRGSWLQSCFGRSIDQLIRVPEGGVRALLPAGPRSAKRKSESGEDTERGMEPVNRGTEVCWSAPRELFKLTEAIESLIERAVADLEMISSGEETPVGWPFETASPKSSQDELLRYALDALDADRPLLPSFPLEATALSKLETLSSLLLRFLSGITDGLLPSTLWESMDSEMLSWKQPLVGEDLKQWALERMSGLPHHNISLVFLMSCLAKVASEVAPVRGGGGGGGGGHDSQNGSGDSRVSSDSFGARSEKSSKSSRAAERAAEGLGRFRKSISRRAGRSPNNETEDPAVVRRREVQRRFAEVFADVVIRGGTKEKGGRERKVGVLMSFLESQP
jgi:hypothetical protein